MKTRAMIIGAGPGGLTAALTLHAIGLEVVVCEAVNEIKPLGVGINLLPHGAAVLHQAGLGNALDAVAIRTRAIEYRTRFGHIIQSDARGIEAGFEYPQYSIHRGDLQQLLVDAVHDRLGEDALRCNRSLVCFESHGDSITTVFTDGSRMDADILIGADGFHSRVRRQLHPDEGPAHVEGVTMWRGTSLREPFSDGRTMFIAGDHDKKIVCYPISETARQRGESLVNWVAELRHDQPGTANDAHWTRQGDRKFIDAFVDFSMNDIDVVEMMRSPKSILEYPMIDRDPLPWWTEERVTLLGDAAHPMYPIGANGASQALVDASELAQCLTCNDPVEGLHRYESRRLQATTDVVLANREAGPEQVLDLASERVKHADDRIEDLISADELEAIAARYRAIAGFQKITS